MIEVTPEELRRSFGIPSVDFDEDLAEESIEQVEALARVYAGVARLAELEERAAGLDAEADDAQARLESVRQVIKQYAKRVYENPGGVLQRALQDAGSTSYADTSEAAHGLNRNLRRAVRSAIGGSRVATPLYASEMGE